MGPQPLGNRFGDRAFGSATISVENARFMSRVYGWMTAGLCLTGAVAWNVSGNPELVQSIFGNRLLFWGLIIAQLGAVAALSGLINRISGLTATVIYFLYAGLTGLTLSSIFLVFTGSSIAEVFGVTAFGFAGLSIVGYVTKRDLGPVGSFCMMGLFGLIGFGLLSMFFPALMSGGGSFVFSIVGIIVFAGLTAYDTQKIKNMYGGAGDGVEAGRKKAIIGALTLYLDFINLFLSLLRLTGRRR
ncbi:MAG: Bax inhibitor-1/YccA family protein [Acidobacteriia bacterium]|nr:Bax inhibitor-1/YccA family protein [Terriglobia bacterium]